MSDQPNPFYAGAPGAEHDPPMSPEELEAAAAANEADAIAALQAAQADLAQLKTQNTELSEQALRAQADAQNARRRADEEIAKSRKFAIEGFAESLLPVLDSLEAALNVDNATAKQLRMLNGTAHAHGAHKLIHRFRKWPTQEAHTRGVAKCCDAAAGTDDNAVAPWQVT